MNVLICNVGSTSLKYQLFRMPEELVAASGGAERVGRQTSRRTPEQRRKQTKGKALGFLAHSSSSAMLLYVVHLPCRMCRRLKKITCFRFIHDGAPAIRLNGEDL